MHTAGGAMSNMSTMTNEMETLRTVDVANSQPWFHVRQDKELLTHEQAVCQRADFARYTFIAIIAFRVPVW